MPSRTRPLPPPKSTRTSIVVGGLIVIAVTAVLYFGRDAMRFGSSPPNMNSTSRLDRASRTPSASTKDPQSERSPESSTPSNHTPALTPVSIRGIVTDEAGTPIKRSISLTVRGSLDGETLEADAVVVRGAEFSIRLTDDIQVVDIEVDAPGFAFMRSRYIPAGTYGVRIVMRRALPLRGHVVDHDGRAIAEAEVSWWPVADPERRVRGETRTESDGAFHFEDVAPLRIYLACAAERFVSRRIYVSDVDTGDDVRIVLLQPASVTGTVVDAETGQPVAQAIVEVRKRAALFVADSAQAAPDEVLVAKVRSDAEGRFIAEDIPSGTRDVSLTGAFTEISLWIETPNYAPRLLRLSEPAPGGRLDTGPIGLFRAASCRGRVVDGEGNGLENLVIAVHPLERNIVLSSSMTEYTASIDGRLSTVNQTRTDDLGTYRFDRLPAHASGTKYVASVATRLQSSAFVVLQPGVEVEASPITIDEDIDARFHGVVIDAETKKPLTGARASASGPAAFSDRTGRFQLSIFERSSERMGNVTVSRRGYRQTRTPLKTKTTTETPHVFEMTRTIEITGTVVDHSGRGVAKVSIRVFDGQVPIEDVRDFDAGLTRPPESQLGVATADSHGRFRLSIAAVESVHLVARAPGVDSRGRLDPNRPRAILESISPRDTPFIIRFAPESLDTSTRATREVFFVSERRGVPIDFSRPVMLRFEHERRIGKRVGPGRYSFDDVPTTRAVELLLPADGRPARQTTVELRLTTTEIPLTDQPSLSVTVATVAGDSPDGLEFDVVTVSRGGSAQTEATPIAVAAVRAGRVEITSLPDGTYRLRLATSGRSLRFEMTGDAPRFEVEGASAATGHVIVRRRN